jgi:NTE family protein
MPADRNPPAASPSPSGGVTLVLGGGGFKGMAHLGVLTVLEEAGVPVERVLGNSVGSLLGANFCHFRSAARTRELVMAFLGSEGFRMHGFVSFRRKPGRVPLMRRLATGLRRQVALERIFRRSSAFGGAAVRYLVRSLVPKVDVADLALPLNICALDMLRGEVVLITKGDLCTAVTASSAVPGFFPPVEWGDTLLCDAGIVDNLPTAMARRAGAERIVAVDLSHGLMPLRRDASGLEILLRAQEISTRLANRARQARADVVIQPELGGRHWLDTSHLEEVVEAGATATRAALPAISALLEGPARRAS